MTDQILSEVMVQIKDHDEQISEGIRNTLNVMCLIQGKRSWKNWGCNQKKGSEEMICIRQSKWIWFVWLYQINLTAGINDISERKLMIVWSKEFHEADFLSFAWCTQQPSSSSNTLRFSKISVSSSPIRIVSLVTYPWSGPFSAFSTVSFTVLLMRTSSTPAARNIRLEAMFVSTPSYLSDSYTILRIPDCMMAFAHSLHGNRDT